MAPSRRRTLPGGRAVVGGLLVALAVLGVFALQSGASRPPSTRFVVAARPIVAGQPITADLLVESAIDLPAEVAARAFATAAELRGTVATTSIGTGELLQASAVAPIDSAPPLHLLTLTLSRARALDGDLDPDTRVDLVGTSGGCTQLIAIDAVVRDRPVKTGNELGSDSVMVRLGVRSSDELLQVVHVAEAGKIMLVRSTTGAIRSAGVQPVCSAGGLAQ